MEDGRSQPSSSERTKTSYRLRAAELGLISEHSNQDEKDDLDQEGDRHDRDRKDTSLTERGFMNASHLAKPQE